MRKPRLPLQFPYVLEDHQVKALLQVVNKEALFITKDGERLKERNIHLIVARDLFSLQSLWVIGI
ncbi:MAG: hypothetical protein QME54_02680 [Actinomycetota bacterium]|nr:hypothetical protein [Actinomycetota bacterium]